MSEESFVYTCCPGWGDHEYCALKTIVKDGKIVRTEKATYTGAEVNEGHICQKGIMSGRQPYNPKRLTHPLKRVGDEFVRISWEQALSEISEKVKDIQSKYSPKAFGFYGVGLAVDQVPMYPLHDLKDFLGSQWVFNPLSVEFVSPWWANGKMIGKQFPPPEGDRYPDRCGSLSKGRHSFRCRRHVPRSGR